MNKLKIFKKYQVWRNKLLRQLDIQVLDIIQLSRTFIKLKVSYYDRTDDYKKLCVKSDIVTIKTKDLINWTKLDS